MEKSWNYKALAVCFAIVIGVAAFGSIFSGTGAMSDWYNSVKPAITPPGWLFGPVWTVLFVLIAFALYFSWNSASTSKQRNAVEVIFGFNLIVNALWSLFFFGLQNAKIAFIDIVLVWISIIWMISLAAKLDRKAAWMLVPYLLWVSFAAVLNFLAI